MAGSYLTDFTGYAPSTKAPMELKVSNLSRLDFSNNTMRHARPRGSTISSLSSAHSAASWSSISSAGTDRTDCTITRSSIPETTSTVYPTSSPQEALCKPPLRVILGTASVGSSKSPLAKITSVEDLQRFVWTFRSRGYADIDTARAYPVGAGGSCERLLGERDLRLKRWANISTKVASFLPGSHRQNNIATSIQQSLDALDVDAVDIMYLHAPDLATSFYEACKAMHDAFEQGKFERFGLSNYSVQQVEEIVHICTVHGFVKPSVYQGQYNPVCRGAEDQLFAMLRKHDIAFYAYSPSACGFFSDKVSRASSRDKDSRWNVASPLGTKYTNDYFHDALFAAAEIVKVQAKKYGISGHAAALRWTTWHSQMAAERGDALIVGASTLAQLEENLAILEQGPLPTALVMIMDKMWREVESFGKGPKYSFTG